jgi:hypothetical protein
VLLTEIRFRTFMGGELGIVSRVAIVLESRRTFRSVPTWNKPQAKRMPLRKTRLK